MVAVWVSAVGCFGLVWPASATAGVILTEVYPAPAAGEAEWFELSNTAAEAVIVAGWSVSDQLASPTQIFTFSPGQQLAGHSTQVFELSSDKLNNSADGLTLQNTSGQVVSSMQYSRSQTGQSWHWTGTEWQLGSPSPNHWQASPTTTPTLIAEPSTTPTATVQTPTASPSLGAPTTHPTFSQPLSQLRLSEIQPCPAEAQSEWVELTVTANLPVSTFNWRLEDATNHQIVLPATLNQAYTQVALPVPVINNSGDALRLYYAGNLVQELEVPACVAGLSWSQITSQLWQWQTPSPGELNPTAQASGVSLSPTSQLTSTPTTPPPKSTTSPKAPPTAISASPTVTSTSPSPNQTLGWIGLNATIVPTPLLQPPPALPGPALSGQLTQQPPAPVRPLGSLIFGIISGSCFLASGCQRSYAQIFPHPILA